MPPAVEYKSVKILSKDNKEPKLSIELGANHALNDYRKLLKALPDSHIFTYGDLPHEEKGERVWIDCQGSYKPKKHTTSSALNYTDRIKIDKNVELLPEPADHFIKIVAALLKDKGLPVSYRKVGKAEAYGSESIVELFVPQHKHLKEELGKLTDKIYEKLASDTSQSRGM